MWSRYLTIFESDITSLIIIWLIFYLFSFFLVLALILELILNEDKLKILKSFLKIKFRFILLFVYILSFISIFIISPLIFYISTIIFLLIISINYFDKNNQIEQFYNNYKGVIHKLLLSIYIVSFTLVFTGLYESNSTITDQISTLGLTVIKTSFFGGLLIYILLKTGKYFKQGVITSQRFSTYNNNNKIVHSLFIILIILFSSVFSIQTNTLIDNNQFLTRKSTISPDASLIAYTVYYNGLTYLIVQKGTNEFARDIILLQTCNETTEPMRCENYNDIEYIQFTQDSSKLYLIQDPYIVLMYDINTKSLTNIYKKDVGVYFLHPFQSINSSMFIIDTIAEPSILSINIKNLENNSSKDYSLADFSSSSEIILQGADVTLVSNDFSKLITGYSISKNGLIFYIIGFYKFDHSKFVQIHNFSIPINSFNKFYPIMQELKWNNNDSIVYFSVNMASLKINSTSAIYSYNYQTNKTDLLLKIPGNEFSKFEINIEKSYIISTYPTEVFSYLNKNFKLVYNISTDLSSWDKSANEFIIREKNNIEYYKYEFESNTLIKEKEIDTNLFLPEKRINYLFLVIDTIFFFVFSIVTLILFVKKIKIKKMNS